MHGVVAAFNKEKALVGAFSVIANLWMDLRFKLYYVARDREKCHFIQSGKSNIVVIFHTRMEPECSLGSEVAQLKDIIGLKRVSISVHFAGEKEPFKKSELLKLKMRKIIFVSGRRDHSHTRLTRGPITRA